MRQRFENLAAGDIFSHVIASVSVLAFLGIVGVHIIGGRDTVVMIHDNLDSSLSTYELLAQNNALLSLRNVPVDGMLGGVANYSLGGIWIYRIIRSLFGGFASYQILIVLERLVAFAGMFWLTWKFLIPHHADKLAISAVMAVAFGTLPFWPFAGLSVAGLPWATGIIWDGLTRRVKWYHIVGLFFLSLSSVLVLSWLFFIPIAIVALLVLHFWGRSGRFHGEPDLRSMRTAWIYLGLFIAFLAATRWIELVGALFQGEPTVRVEFPKDYRAGLGSALRRWVSFLLHGQYHAHSLHYIVFPLAFVGFGAAIGRTRRIPVLVSVIGALLVAIAGVYGLYHWSGVALLERLVPPLQQLNWSRFHWLVPLLWWSLAALALAEIASSHRRIFMIALVGTLVFQAGLNTLYSDPVAGARQGDPTFRQFFAEELFDEVRADMDARDPDALAVAVGMHPSVLQYNEIHTLDGYLSVAPLSRKHLWIEILKNELTKSDQLADYVHATGRLYLYSSELTEQSGSVSPQVYKWKEFAIHDLDVSTEVLARHGVRFIVSALPIGNANDLQLELVESYTADNSAWDIWLYSIED